MSDDLLSSRYRLKSLLGRGGMGQVWEARDELLSRDVAIKEIKPDGLTVAELGDLRERAMREARATAQVDHPNVVRIFDVIEHEGAPWIVMELVRARSLYDVVSEDGPLTPEETARIGLGVLGALQAAHRAGILHRDVKPANVLLGTDGRVVLTDFGLAVLLGDSAMTRTGVLLGSPSYLAPERARDEPASAGSDLWSLGATLFAAVEGVPPYERSSPMATLAALMIEPPTTPQQAGPLEPVLKALLEKDPAKRATADEAAGLLKHALSGSTTKPQPTPALVPAPASEPESSAASSPEPGADPVPGPDPEPSSKPAPDARPVPESEPSAAASPAATAASSPTAVLVPSPTPAKAIDPTLGTPIPGRRSRGPVVAVVAIAAAVVAASIATVVVTQNSDSTAAQPAPSLDEAGVRLPGLETPSATPSAHPSATPSRRSSPTPAKPSPTSKKPKPTKPTPTAKATTTPPPPKPIRVTFEAESYTDNQGTEDSFPQEASGGRVVGHTANGNWVGYRNHPLTGIRTVTLRYAGRDGHAVIEMRGGSATGTLLATVTMPATGDFSKYATVTGTLNAKSSGALFLVFRGPDASDVDQITLAS